MKKHIILASILTVATFSVQCGADKKTTAERIKDISALTANIDDGENAYATHCSFCHGINGEGKSDAPAIPEAIEGRSDTELYTAVIDGIGSMPGLGSKLTDQEISNIVAFIKSDQ